MYTYATSIAQFQCFVYICRRVVQLLHLIRHKSNVRKWRKALPTLNWYMDTQVRLLKCYKQGNREKGFVLPKNTEMTYMQERVVHKRASSRCHQYSFHERADQRDCCDKSGSWLYGCVYIFVFYETYLTHVPLLSTKSVSTRTIYTMGGKVMNTNNIHQTIFHMQMEKGSSLIPV